MLIARDWYMLRELLLAGAVQSFRTQSDAQKAAMAGGFACCHVHKVDVGGVYGAVWIVGQKHLHTRNVAGIELDEITCLANKGSVTVRKDQVRSHRMRFATTPKSAN